MKKLFKTLLICLLILPIFIKAAEYNESVKLVNEYYKKYDTFSYYYLTSTNLPYEYNGSNKKNALFVTGGMISQLEYDITDSNNVKSYLFDGTKFWEINGNVINKFASIAKTKVTEFTRTDIKVKGSGTFKDPWRFNESYKVIIKSNGNGYIEETGKLSYSKVVDSGSNITFYIVTTDGYAYLSNDCGSYASVTGNKLLIQNVNKNITCSVTFGVDNAVHSLPTVKYTINNPNTGLRECVFSNANPQNFYVEFNRGYFKDEKLTENLGHVEIPYRRGWTFNGYYVDGEELISSMGDFTHNYSLLKNSSKTITFKATENKYKITFDVSKYNVGSTSASLGTNSLTATFDHDPSTITIPYKEGYTFEGYYLEGKFDSSVSGNTKYFDSTGKSVHYWDEASNTTLYANWVANQYTLYYNANGGSVSPASKTITFDQKYGTLATPTRAGYVFAGWYTASSGGTKVTENTYHRVNASGKAANVTIYAHWTPCSTGHYCPGDNTEIACAKGTYQNQTAQSTCVQCNTGQYQDEIGKTSCKACTTGHYCPSKGMSSPTACPKGQYQNQTGQTSCIACAKGYYASSEGTVNCSACPAGSVTNSTGTVTCTKCAAGTYQPYTGKVSCYTCASGNYTNTGNSTGATTCTACPTGYKCDGKTKTACPAGYYSDYTGRDYCNACGTGYYTNTGNSTGATTCNICPKGSYCNGKVKTECAAGTYQSETGKSSCNNCPAGKYASGTGNTSCSECGAGYYSLTGSEKCTACPSNYPFSTKLSTAKTKCYYKKIKKAAGTKWTGTRKKCASANCSSQTTNANCKSSGACIWKQHTCANGMDSTEKSGGYYWVTTSESYTVYTEPTLNQRCNSSSGYYRYISKTSSKYCSTGTLSGSYCYSKTTGTIPTGWTYDSAVYYPN